MGQVVLESILEDRIMIDLKEIRQISLTKIRDLGYPVNETLPLLENDLNIRSYDEVCNRILTLYACVACSFGFSVSEALKWIKKEKLKACLTGMEAEFLRKKSNNKIFFQWQVESLWALTWAVSLHDDLNFFSCCENDFISLFPDIKQQQNTQDFRKKGRLRSQLEIVEMLDFSYCLHWLCTENLLKKKSLNHLDSNIIRERRRALEWILSDHDWDEIVLDT